MQHETPQKSPIPPETVSEVILAALKTVQGLGGYDWVDLAPDEKVIGQLEGFDSLTGIEATVSVEQELTKKLGREQPLSLGKDSIFVSDDGRKALTLSQVVENVSVALEAAA